MREEARVGDRILEITSHAFKKSGKAASELGIDLERILADPNLMEQYGRQVVGFIAAYWAWVNADRIKFAMAKVQAVVAGYAGQGGMQTKGWWWSYFLTSPIPATIELVTGMTDATASIDAEADAYRDKVSKLLAHKDKETGVVTVDPLPPKPAFMSATFEERLIFAALAYVVASNPEVLAEALKGLGFVTQGVGELVPG